MKKTDFSSLSSTALFGTPVPYQSSVPDKTIMVSLEKNEDGSPVVSHICVEDKMSQIIAFEYNDVTLANLVDKGVEPHSLDMIDTQKLGVDAGVDALSERLMSDPKFVESKNS